MVYDSDSGERSKTSTLAVGMYQSVRFVWILLSWIKCHRLCAQRRTCSPCSPPVKTSTWTNPCFVPTMGDLLDASVQSFKLRRPELQIFKCGSGIYEVQGRKIKLESHAMSLEPLVVDGPLRQPLGDYIDGSGRNEAWQPPLVQSALHALPQARRVSFEELYPQNRMDAMRLAVLEANAREVDAKEQLSRSPSPDRRYHRRRSPDGRASQGFSPARAPTGPTVPTVPTVPAPVLFTRPTMVFGTTPRTPSMRSIHTTSVAPMTPVASMVPLPLGVMRPSLVSPIPSVASVPGQVRERSSSPCAVRTPSPCPSRPVRMALPELKQAFTELKTQATALKHQLQSLQARAIEEMTRNVDVNAPVSPPKEETDLISGAWSDDLCEEKDSSTSTCCIFFHASSGCTCRFRMYILVAASKSKPLDGTCWSGENCWVFIGKEPSDNSAYEAAKEGRWSGEVGWENFQDFNPNFRGRLACHLKSNDEQITFQFPLPNL